MTDHTLDILIDEVVLGLAEPAEAARIETMAARDPEIAARLEAARERFSPLDETADEIALPDDFWSRVERGLDAPQPEILAEAANEALAEVVALSAMRRAAARWRSLSLVGLAASILLALVFGWTLLSPQRPVVIAVLVDERGEVVALVEGRADNTTLVTLLERAEIPAESVMQVWTKPDDEGPPVSLGLLASGRSERLTATGLPSPHPRQLYEITVEPAGGSPTNLPTGPILGKGLAKAPVI